MARLLNDSPSLAPSSILPPPSPFPPASQPASHFRLTHWHTLRRGCQASLFFVFYLFHSVHFQFIDARQPQLGGRGRDGLGGRRGSRPTPCGVHVSASPGRGATRARHSHYLRLVLQRRGSLLLPPSPATHTRAASQGEAAVSPTQILANPHPEHHTRPGPPLRPPPPV